MWTWMCYCLKNNEMMFVRKAIASSVDVSASLLFLEQKRSCCSCTLRAGLFVAFDDDMLAVGCGIDCLSYLGFSRRARVGFGGSARSAGCPAHTFLLPFFSFLFCASALSLAGGTWFCHFLGLAGLLCTRSRSLRLAIRDFEQRVTARGVEPTRRPGGIIVSSSSSTNQAGRAEPRRDPQSVYCFVSLFWPSVVALQLRS